MLFFIREDGDVYQVDEGLTTPPVLLTAQRTPSGLRGLGVRTFRAADGASHTALYISADLGRVYKYNPSSTDYELIGQSVDNTPLPGLAIGKDGTLWASGNSGVYSYKYSTPTVLLKRIIGGWEANAQLQRCAGTLFTGPSGVGLAILQGIGTSSQNAIVVPSTKFTFIDALGNLIGLPPNLTPLALHVEEQATGLDGTRLWLGFTRLSDPGDPSYHTRVISAAMTDILNALIPPYPTIPSILHHPPQGKDEATQFWNVAVVPPGALPGGRRVVMINDGNDIIFIERYPDGPTQKAPHRSKALQWAELPDV